MPLPTQHAIPNTQSVHRVQDYLHFKARAGRESLVIGGFTLYLSGSDPASGVSLVLPNRPAAAATSSALERIERIFARRGLPVCFQWLDAYAPGLAGQLTERGFLEQERLSVLTGEAGALSSPYNGSGLTFVTLSAESPLADVAENWNINAQGFDPDAPLAEPGDVEGFRNSLTDSRAFTARLDGTGVSAGMYTDIHDGVTELVGIATLPAYRRRGYGGALTAYAAQCAFTNGAALVFLSAASAEASRVYQRVGFGLVGELRLMSKRLSPADP